MRQRSTLKWKLLFGLLAIVIAGVVVLGVMEPALVQHDVETPLSADQFKQKS